MNTVISSLLVLTILPIVCAWVAGYYKNKQLGTVDNKEPRAQALLLTGPGARAVAAQANCWEALAIYAAALLAIVISGVDVGSIETLALAMILLRVAYVPAYISNIDKLRSLLFLGSFGISLYLFYLALAN